MMRKSEKRRVGTEGEREGKRKVGKSRRERERQRGTKVIPVRWKRIDDLNR